MAGKKEKDLAGGVASSPDYSYFFSNNLAIYYMSSFPARFSTATNEEEIAILSEEFEIAMTVYGLLVYYAYSKRPEVRKAIDSNSEFRTKFGIVKDWMEAHDGKRLIDQWMERMKTGAVEPPEE